MTIKKIVYVLFIILISQGCRATYVLTEKTVWNLGSMNNPCRIIINHDVDLGGKTWIVPPESELMFSGGILLNGIIVGNNTMIKGTPAFSKVSFRGRFSNELFFTSWERSSTHSSYFFDIYNLESDNTVFVDSDVRLSNKKLEVRHISLKGDGKSVIFNPDIFYVTGGDTEISDVTFKWVKDKVKEPSNNYSACVVYTAAIAKLKSAKVVLHNVVADGNGYCSYFLKQSLPGQERNMLSELDVKGCFFSGFTRGVLWTCGGCGTIERCIFKDIGYDTTNKLLSVNAIRLGIEYSSNATAIVNDYLIKNNRFENIVAAYNGQNDGRELHAILGLGNKIVVVDNVFENLSTSFTRYVDPGQDAEMIYIKGSNNYVYKNIVKNGAGRDSDAMITLKTETSQNNTIENNRMEFTDTPMRFVYLGGRGVVLKNNTMIGKVSNGDCFSNNPEFCAIYLRRSKTGVDDDILIEGNELVITSTKPIVGVFGKSRNHITLRANSFSGISHLLIAPCYTNGSRIIENNTVSIDSKTNNESGIIDISGVNDAEIRGNSFQIAGAGYPYLVRGSSYSFQKNFVKSNSISYMKTLLSGGEKGIYVENNTLDYDSKGQIPTSRLYDKRETKVIVFRDNKTK